jgi:hypothetical protein
MLSLGWCEVAGWPSGADASGATCSTDGPTGDLGDAAPRARIAAGITTMQVMHSGGGGPGVMVRSSAATGCPQSACAWAWPRVAAATAATGCSRCRCSSSGQRTQRSGPTSDLPLERWGPAGRQAEAVRGSSPGGQPESWWRTEHQAPAGPLAAGRDPGPQRHSPRSVVSGRRRPRAVRRPRSGAAATSPPP